MTEQKAGFYKKTGNKLSFAPTAVHFPGGSSISVVNHGEHTYPVEGWTYYESEDEAYAAEGLPLPEPKANAIRGNVAERIAARRAMSREEKDAERAQREADRIARLETRNPEQAAKLRARAEERQARRVARDAMRAESEAKSISRLVNLKNAKNR
jgi:hypothetical protein